MNMVSGNFIVYRVYYGDDIVYVGRTKQKLTDRISAHLFNNNNNKKNRRTFDIDRVSKIEFAKCKTESDMNLYELYYILKCKPALNSKDVAPDKLTENMNELEFKEAVFPMWEQWKLRIHDDDKELNIKKESLNYLVKERVQLYADFNKSDNYDKELFRQRLGEIDQQIEYLNSLLINTGEERW